MNRRHSKVRKLLVDRGEEVLRKRKGTQAFSGLREADALLNDLRRYPHAFVLACIMDRQIRAELAWIVPYRLCQKLGNFRFSTLSGLSRREIARLMTKPEPLHRYPVQMAGYFHAGVRHIKEGYGGNASRIWNGRPSSAAVVFRFLEFEGVGQKIATMAANILARRLKVRFSDYYSIDISVDVHVRRVFYRLGLIPKNATNDQIIYSARSLNPEFPGILDFPAWDIGRRWCKVGKPECPSCYMRRTCPTSLSHG